MKRQRGRGRKPGGGGGNGGGGGHNHGNRSLESSGPEVKIRGTAAQIYEKYAQYARDAQSGGDRVKYEALLQHAEHYYRVMAASMPRERLLAQQNGEGELIHSGQQSGEGGNVQQQHEGGSQQGHEQPDALKVMDDNAGDTDSDEGDEVESSDSREGDEVEASGQDNAQQGDQDQEGGGRNRRRRGRNRNRNNDDRPNNNGNNNDGEARSALDSLARKQGALS